MSQGCNQLSVFQFYTKSIVNLQLPAISWKWNLLRPLSFSDFRRQVLTSLEWPRVPVSGTNLSRLSVLHSRLVRSRQTHACLMKPASKPRLNSFSMFRNIYEPRCSRGIWEPRNLRGSGGLHHANVKVYFKSCKPSYPHKPRSRTQGRLGWM